MTNDPTAKVHQKKFILEDTNQKSQVNLADLTQIPMQYNILAKHKSQQDIASQNNRKTNAKKVISAKQNSIKNKTSQSNTSNTY